MSPDRETPTTQELRTRLRQVVESLENDPERRKKTKDWRHSSSERFVLECGHPFESQPLTTAEQAVVDEAVDYFHEAFGLFEYRHCFWNAQWLVTLDFSGKLAYVEGFVATRLPSPELHGWAAINGKLIDVTVPVPGLGFDGQPEEPTQVHGEFEGRTYLGVPFLRKYMNQRARVAGGRDGSLIDAWQHGWPLLVDGADGAVRKRWP